MPDPAAPVRLTEWTSCGGCAAKWGAAPLRALVAELADAGATDPLLIGLAPSDDAAVYRLTDDLALVSTTDFFPPPIDDPHDFGVVAAANACSDVFAMGGEVRLALNLAAFPEELPTEAIAAILDGAAETVRAAGGVVAGGHTIRNPEPIFGLAVQGLVHPERVWTKGRVRAGDALVLSKPLGTGIALAGGEPSAMAAAVASMSALNRHAAAQLAAVDGGAGPHACTDVTGYGLLGHAWEMADRSGLALHLDAGSLPLLPGAHAAAARGVRTGGDARNREAHQAHVDVGPNVEAAVEALAHDPQTSGGLLAAVPPRAAERLRDQGWAVIGETAPGPARLALA